LTGARFRLLTARRSRFAGRRPVLSRHPRRPEAWRSSLSRRYNYFIQELGIAVIRPNVRSSSGFRQDLPFARRRIKRQDSVKDIGALLTGSAQPGLDPARVMVSGGSYGGYMSLAVSTHYADRIAGSRRRRHLNFAASSAHRSYRRDLRRSITATNAIRRCATSC
jgi:predicted dienelactone hydrolase